MIEEYYNNSGKCINIPLEACGCCDTIKEFYAQAKEWYENIMKILDPKEDTEPKIDYSTITFKISPDNGCGMIYLVIDTKYSTLPSKQNFTIGDEIELLATPLSSSYVFSEWLKNGESLGTSSRLSYKVTNKDTTITAKFVRRLDESLEVVYTWYIGGGATYNDIMSNKRTYKPNIEGAEVTKSINVNIPETGNFLFIVVPSNMVIKDIILTNVSFIHLFEITEVEGLKIYRKRTGINPITNSEVGENAGDNTYTITYGIV